MLEKIIIKMLKGLAATVYVCLLTAIFSVPVIFIYQAFKEPVFTLNKTETVLNIEEDGYLSAIGEELSHWQRIDYSLTAESGRFSPYYYRIEEFIPAENSLLHENSGCRIVIDEPLYFTNTIKDDFVISVYIRNDSGINTEEVAKSALFRAKSYEKGFFEFAITYDKS